MTDVRSIPLDRLVIDEDFQPRDKVNADHVEALAASDPATWPPLLVFPRDDGRFTILDGAHRREVARRLNLPALRCHVDPSAGYPEAVQANLRHGLPLTKAERKTYARWLRENEPKLSLREIASRCGLSPETVRTALGTGQDESRPASNYRTEASAIDKLLGDAGKFRRKLIGQRTVEQAAAEVAAAIRRTRDPKKVADTAAGLDVTARVLALAARDLRVQSAAEARGER